MDIDLLAYAAISSLSPLAVLCPSQHQASLSHQVFHNTFRQVNQTCCRLSPALSRPASRRRRGRRWPAAAVCKVDSLIRHPCMWSEHLLTTSCNTIQLHQIWLVPKSHSLMQKSFGKRTSTEELLIRVIIPKPGTPPIQHGFLWRCGHTEPALRAHLTNPTAPQNRNLQFLIPPLRLFGCKNVSVCKVSAGCPLPKESRTVSATPHSASGPAARLWPRPPLSTREAI